MDNEPLQDEAPTGPEVDLDLGAGVRVSVLPCLTSTAINSAATRNAPGTWPLTLVSGGPLAWERDQDNTLLEPGDLVLWDPVRPVAVTSAVNCPARATVLRLPQHALSIPERELHLLVGRPAPSASGPGALLARFLEGIVEQASSLRAARTERLGWAAVDLAVEFLSGLVERSEPTTSLSREAELLQQLTTFIDQHLDDPDLSPMKVAAAHHMSLRSVHYVFHRDDRTVGRHIREQRLERCRADLVDPSFASLNVGRIRARWGFSDDTVFCRTFKRAYGITPGEWRRKHLGPQ